LFARDSQALLQAVALPVALQDRTAPEQAEFLLKALRDEISAEGLAVLRRRGKFGPLATIIPAEAASWASQAGVAADLCIAFRLDRSTGPRGELVLHRGDVVRGNNLKLLPDRNLILWTSATWQARFVALFFSCSTQKPPLTRVAESVKRHEVRGGGQPHFRPEIVIHSS
jgi:hypothetical protein